MEFCGLRADEGPERVEPFRKGLDHRNAFDVWKQMGSPQILLLSREAGMQGTSDLTFPGSPEWVMPDGGMVTLRSTPPRQAIALLRLSGDRRPG